MALLFGSRRGLAVTAESGAVEVTMAGFSPAGLPALPQEEPSRGLGEHMSVATTDLALSQGWSFAGITADLPSPKPAAESQAGWPQVSARTASPPLPLLLPPPPPAGLLAQLREDE